MRKMKAAGLVVAIGLVSTAAYAQYYGYQRSIVPQQIAWYIISAVAGFLLGALFSDKARRFWPYIKWTILGLLFIISFTATFPTNALLTGVACILVFFGFAGLALRLLRLPRHRRRSTTFGSARWATAEYLQERGIVGREGLALGYFYAADGRLPLHYTSDRHLLTVAPTRAGKGVSSIIPNLLSYRGSALVIDPKGENAMCSALRRGHGDQEWRIEGMGQAVHIVDPWRLTAEVTGLEPACFNPLDWLDPASPEIGENAMMLADALVVPAPGGNKDPFWDEEAKSLLMGFILHVATSPAEAGQRHLGRVRDMLMLPVQEADALVEAMLSSVSPIVVGSGARMAGRDPKLQAGILSAAQSHTHFLDSPALRASLSRSDFRFEDLKTRPMTVYLVLPADRLAPFGRWLRLLIQQAITVTARNILARPERPILFMLDEMAALGRLTMVEQAYGLMAGFGMQLWGIVQDLSQLHRIYGDGWQTFIGNAGVLQYFGSRDKMTAEYFSALCGQETIRTLSSTISSGMSGDQASSSTSHTHGEAQRSLILPDELMRVDADVQLVLIENLDPIAGRKVPWYADARFADHGVNLRRLPATPAVDPPAEMAQAA